MFNHRPRLIILFLVHWCTIFNVKECGVDANSGSRNKRPALPDILAYAANGGLDFRNRNQDGGPFGPDSNTKNGHFNQPLNSNYDIGKQYAPPEAQIFEPQKVQENYPPQSPQIVEPQPEIFNNFPEAPPQQQFQPPPSNPVYQQAQPVPLGPITMQVQKPPEDRDSLADNSRPYLFQSQEEVKCIEDMCICPMIYDPVCGFDGNPMGHQYPDKGFRTFGNACAFRCSQKCNKYLQFTYCGECSPNHYIPNPGDPAPSIRCISDAPIQPQPLVEPLVLRREPREGSRILLHDDEK